MTRSYPWKCAECGSKAVQPAVIEHHAKVKHENTLHDVHVPNLPVHKCSNCGDVLVGEDADELIRATLRENLRLMPQASILSCRNALHVTQGELAEMCGFAAETLSRWENGGLQSRSSDKLLRLFFGLPQARKFLRDLQTSPRLGEAVVWDVAHTYDFGLDYVTAGVATGLQSAVGVVHNVTW